MSSTVSAGLATLSPNISRVSGFIALSISISDESGEMNVVVMPSFASVVPSRLKVPP